MKFGRDCKVELIKYFKIYRHFLLKVLRKIGLNFVLFHGWKWGKWIQSLIYDQKAVFSTNHCNLSNNLQNYMVNLAKFNKLF